MQGLKAVDQKTHGTCYMFICGLYIDSWEL